MRKGKSSRLSALESARMTIGLFRRLLDSTYQVIILLALLMLAI